MLKARHRAPPEPQGSVGRKESGMGQSVSGVEAVVILLACTSAILLFTYVWAASNMRPVRRRTGRRFDAAQT